MSVVRYRLGCAIKGSGNLKTLSMRAIENEGFAPGAAYETRYFGASEGIPNNACKGAAKLVIVEAEFEDGTVWKINRQVE